MQRTLRPPLLSRITAGLTFMLLLVGSALADTLVVQPEQLSLSTANPLGHLEFHNTSEEETTLTFDVVQWHQNSDREWFTPSRDLLIVPQIITLKPGQSEKIRVGMRLSGSFWDEEAFRIMVTEKIRPPDVGTGTALHYNGQVSRPSSVAVFVQPPGKASPRISWSFKRNVDGGVTLRARNSGKGHVQLNSASLLGPGGQSLQKPSMTDVVLPGGARAWEFPANAVAGNWHLIADTNAGPMRVTLELAPDASSATALSFSQ